MELSSSKDYISKAIKQVKILKKLTIVYWRERLVSGKSYLNTTSTVSCVKSDFLKCISSSRKQIRQLSKIHMKLHEGNGYE